MNTLRFKQVAPDDMQVNQDRRECLAIVSTSDIDRDGEIVVATGLVTSGVNYAGRPVLLAHDTSKLPIGSILWIKAEKDKILCKFRLSDKTQQAKDAYDLVQDGSLRFLSIGFSVLQESPPTPQEIKDNPNWAGAMNVVRKLEIYELSLCAVPANPYTEIVAKDVDCWQYESKAETVKPVPTPRYTRKYNIDQHIKDILRRHDPQDIVDRIKGRA